MEISKIIKPQSGYISLRKAVSNQTVPFKGNESKSYADVFRDNSSINAQKVE